jgi:hypothetical protein
MIPKANGKVCNGKSRHPQDPKKLARRNHRCRLVITFFDIKGIVHFEFIPQGQIINQAYYVELLKWLHEAVHRKRPELRSYDWTFQHENAPPHKALPVCQAVFGPKIDYGNETSTLFP